VVCVFMMVFLWLRMPAALCLFGTQQEVSGGRGRSRGIER
jgi:hypothetical protein